MGRVLADSLWLIVPGLLAGRSLKEFVVLSDEFSLVTTAFVLSAIIVSCNNLLT